MVGEQLGGGQSLIELVGGEQVCVGGRWPLSRTRSWLALITVDHRSDEQRAAAQPGISEQQPAEPDSGPSFMDI